jgi:preprotein translocase subunit YajC
MFATPAYAQAAGAPPGADSFLLQLLPLVLIFVIFYFLLIRPQQKRAKEHAQMVENLRRGDQVVLSGGIMGRITKVRDDDEAEVEIAENTRIRVVKSTIAQVVSKTEPANEG